MTTDFSNKVNILGDFYLKYKDDENLKDFITFNDLGLPLAYFASEALCEITDDGIKYILETWDLLMAALDIEDKGFEDLEQVFNSENKDQ